MRAPKFQTGDVQHGLAEDSAPGVGEHVASVPANREEAARAVAGAAPERRTLEGRAEESGNARVDVWEEAWYAAEARKEAQDG